MIIYVNQTLEFYTGLQCPEATADAASGNFLPFASAAAGGNLEGWVNFPRGKPEEKLKVIFTISNNGLLALILSY